jgi:aspartyl-tRNA(Asn)/glutamyl-tRNA(Gln) amidotransferase subunit A
VIDESAVTLASRVAKGEVTAVALAERALARIDATDAKLHAFLTVTRDVALDQARAVDAKRARGEPLGALAGVPIALKDAICTRGVRTTAGSKILGDYAPPYDATVTSKLRAADAVLVGKTNLDEFAMGSSTENSAFGPSSNPWDIGRSPGGSSGGSAVAVAARMAAASLGSDTGGSIRQPAAFTGTVGLKPTYGRVSRYGLVAFASSLDQIGPFTTDVASAARLLGVIAGRDPRDATSVDVPLEDYERACGTSVGGLRIGVPDEYFAEGIDADVEASVRAAIRSLEADGCVVKPVKLSHTRYAVATYYVVATAEASSNLARFDGVRYGTRVEKRDLREMYGATRDAGFGAEVKRRILLGTYVLSAGYYDAYYLKAQKVRTLIRRDFDAAFRDVDVIVSPTAPTPAFKLGEKTADPIAMYLNDVYTLPASLAGLPGISVPCAPAASGLPIGLQIVAPAFCESRLFTIASAWEKSCPPRAPTLA